jgi:hypothetical protein
MNPTTTAGANSPSASRQELANQLFREYYSRCFWHCPHDLVITEGLIPFVVKGLRTYGGRQGYMLASKLQANAAASGTSSEEPVECR